MSESTYTAQLVGPDGTESVELELVAGEPQRSFVRPSGEDGQEMVWELDAEAEGAVYRPGGIPSADYS